MPKMLEARIAGGAGGGGVISKTMHSVPSPNALTLYVFLCPGNNSV